VIGLHFRTIVTKILAAIPSDDTGFVEGFSLTSLTLDACFRSDHCRFCEKAEVIEHYRILKPITLDTARKWMSKLDFAWRNPPKGTYIDGHERPDVVHYRQNIYLPALAQYESMMRAWDTDNLTHIINPSFPSPIRHRSSGSMINVYSFKTIGRNFDGFTPARNLFPCKGDGISLMYPTSFLLTMGGCVPLMGRSLPEYSSAWCEPGRILHQ